MITRLGLVAATVCAAGTLGCFSGGPVPTYQVTGTVKFPDGSPLGGGQILARPMESTKYSARGEIGTDGSFTLTTFEVGDGAIAGTHSVMVTPPIARESLDAVATRGKKSPDAIDRRYQSLATTPLSITVASDGSSANHFDLVVEPPKTGRRR